ncbi:hypothetical protein CU100_07750 [Phyllobacterium endophyticum]|uniref:Calcium-binding protein n=2 Tax=Phyllobacterium endophyticum TaxID=1149773 RepID=A0A2P7B249_9HYPH|nr:hypothetical protein CU100_07750 [Phyllobacterium endophyticum]
MAAGRISKTSTDGINGSQLFATNSAVGTLGDRVTANETAINKNTGDITTNTSNIANITNGKAGLVQQALPGANITVAEGLDGAAVDIAGTTAGKKGPRRLINLDAGVDATDAVNVGQLTTVDNKVTGHETRITKNEGNITSITNNVGNLTDRAVQYDGKIGDPKTRITLLGAGGTTIGNLANGKIAIDSLEAVNGSQLYGVSNSTATILGGGAAVNPDGTVKSPTYTIQNTTVNTVEAALRGLDTQVTTNTGAINTINTNIGNLKNDALLWDATTNAFSANHGGAGPNKIANVKAGENDTDAVNVGQLSGLKDVGTAAVKSLADRSLQYSWTDTNNNSLVDQGEVDYTKSKLRGQDSSGKDVGTTIGNLANGKIAIDSLEAVNGSQLFGVSNSTATILGGGAAVNPDGTIKSPTYTIQTKDVHTVAEALGHLDTQVTTNTGAITTINTNIGNLKNDALLWDATTNAFSANHGGSGPNKIANVKDGENDTDAVNFGQLRGLATTGKSLGDVAVKYAWDDKNGNGELDPGEIVDYSKIKLAGAGATGTVISNLANGRVAIDSLDAVNGSQLWSTSNSFATFLGGGTAISGGGLLKGPTYNIASIAGDGTTGAVNVFTNVGDALGGLNSNITNVNDLVTNLNTRFEASRLDALRWDEGKKSFTAVHGGGGGGTKIAPVNPVASGTNKITDLQAGDVNPTSTDAVNGSQLHDTNQKIAVLDENAVKYKLNPDGSKTNEVSLQGADPNAPVLISNLQAGKADNDAVNVRQLKAETANLGNVYLDQSKAYTNTVTASTLNQSTSYTDSKITNVNGRIDKLTTDVNDGFARLSSDIGVARKEAYQAAAIGLAASSLRYDSTPGKLSVAMGGGVWRDQAAMAFGAGYTSESGKVRANVTGAASDGQVGVGAGVSFTLN